MRKAFLTIAALLAMSVTAKACSEAITFIPQAACSSCMTTQTITTYQSVPMVTMYAAPMAFRAKTIIRARPMRRLFRGGSCASGACGMMMLY